MSVLRTVIIKSYDGSKTLATLTVEDGSSLYILNEGIMNVKQSGDISMVYTHSGIFLGISELHPHAIVPLYGIGEYVEMTDDFTFYVVEGVLINGTWKLPAGVATFTSSEWLTPDGAITRQPVTFTSNDREFSSFTYLKTDPTNSSKFRVLYDSTIACEYKANDGTFWNDDAFQTIDFGENYQTVSKAFYQWFTSVATDQTPRAAITIWDVNRDKSYVKKAIAPLVIHLTHEGVFDVNGDVIYKHSSNKAFKGLVIIEGAEEPDYAVGDTVTIDAGKDETFYVIEGEEHPYYVVRSATIKGIADAIRSKTGKTDLIDIEDFASEISNLRLSDVSDDDFATDDDIDDIFGDE